MITIVNLQINLMKFVPRQYRIKNTHSYKNLRPTKSFQLFYQTKISNLVGKVHCLQLKEIEVFQKNQIKFHKNHQIHSIIKLLVMN